MNQLKKKVAALEKEVANAKELNEKLKVCTGKYPAHAQGLCVRRPQRHALALHLCEPITSVSSAPALPDLPS